MRANLFKVQGFSPAVKHTLKSRNQAKSGYLKKAICVIKLTTSNTGSTSQKSLYHCRTLTVVHRIMTMHQIFTCTYFSVSLAGYRYLHEKDVIVPHSPETWRRTQAARFKLVRWNSAWSLAGVSADVPETNRVFWWGVATLCFHFFQWPKCSARQGKHQRRPAKRDEPRARRGSTAPSGTEE